MKTCHGLFRAAILVIFSAAVLLLLSAGGGAVGQANDREPTHKNKTVREWLEDLTSKDPNAVLQARTALRAMGKSAIPVLVVTAQDKKSPLRLQALSALAQEGSNASATLRDLMELLKDEELAIRLRTAHVLNQLGPMAKYSLGLAAKSPDSKVRQAANLALL
jgi:HEAT repeat protein